MENKVLKLGGERSTQDVYAEIKKGNSERWTIQSQKRKYVNGQLLSGVIEVGYSASINTPNYILEEDKSINCIQITAQADGTSGLCILTQNESGNKINLHLTTPLPLLPLPLPTFTLSGLPTGRGYFLFGKGAKPRNTSPSDQVYLQGLSATGTITLRIPFDTNDSEPGTRIECTTGDRVDVYTKIGAWTLEGSFIVPSAGGTVSI